MVLSRKRCSPPLGPIDNRRPDARPGERLLRQLDLIAPATRIRALEGNRRLHHKWETCDERHKMLAKANTAIARELAGWCWSLAAPLDESSPTRTCPGGNAEGALVAQGANSRAGYEQIGPTRRSTLDPRPPGTLQPKKTDTTVDKESPAPPPPPGAHGKRPPEPNPGAAYPLPFDNRNYISARRRRFSLCFLPECRRRPRVRKIASGTARIQHAQPEHRTDPKRHHVR
jgi:hypothetical protein